MQVSHPPPFSEAWPWQLSASGTTWPLRVAGAAAAAAGFTRDAGVEAAAGDALIRWRLLGVDLIVNQLIIKTHVVLCCIDSDVLPLTLENWMQAIALL